MKLKLLSKKRSLLYQKCQQFLKFQQYNQYHQKPKKSLKKIYLEKRVNTMMGKRMDFGLIGIKKVLKKRKYYSKKVMIYYGLFSLQMGIKQEKDKW